MSASDKAYQRRATHQGIGSPNGSGEREASQSPPPPSAPPSGRRTLPVPADPEPRAMVTLINEPKPASKPPRVESGPSRPPRGSRNPVAVDDLGPAPRASVQPLAAKPKVVKSRGDLAAAPLDPREAFLLSMIDGQLTVGSLIDASGMSADEVHTILARLRRLGIVAYG
jgi:hypothetical protein